MAKKTTLKLFYLVAVSFAIAALANEVARSVILNMNPTKSKVWKYKYVLNRRSGQNTKLISGTTSIIYQYDDRLGWRITPNNYTENFCDRKTFTSMPDGTRITTSVTKNSDNRSTILFIGDSFVEGSEVSDSNTMCYLVNDRLDSVHVVNAGVGGYGFGQIYIYLQELLEHHAPEAVVLGYVQTDIDRVNLNFRDYYKPYFKPESGKLTEYSDHIIPADELMKINEWKPALYMGFEIFRETVSNDLEEEENIRLSIEIIKAMNRLCSQKGIPFVLYNLSTPNDHVNSSNFLAQKASFHQISDNVETSGNFDASSFLHSKKSEMTKFTGHWDSLGNHYLAEYFVDSVYPELEIH